VRRLEYIGGGSAKFWEGVVQGNDVVVTWGRIGTGGQSKRKEFGSARDAAAFLSKQADEKVRKGYTDAGAVAAPPVPAAEELVAEEPPVPIAGKPVAEAPVVREAVVEEPVTEEPAALKPVAGEPVAGAPAAQELVATRAGVAVVDEDTFDPAPGVVRMAFPRRDQGRPRYRPSPDARVTVDTRLSRHRRDIDAVLAAAGTDERVAAATRAHLDGTPDPLGAAAVLTVVNAATSHYDRDDLGRFGQCWLAEHGLLFAVEAAMRLTTLTTQSADGRTNAGVLRHLADGENQSWRWAGPEVLGELRSAVAAAGDDEYAQVVELLAGFRSNTASRLGAAFLAPTETAWVDALADEVDAYRHLTGWMYLSVVHSAEQLDAISVPFGLHRQSRTLPTIVRTVGPGAAPTLLRWTANADSDMLKRLLAAVVAMPTDEAFLGLVAGADQAPFRAALQEAVQRYPVRATRLLAHAAAQGSAVAVELLRTHLSARHELLTDVVPTLPAAAREAALATQEGVVRLPDATPDLLPPVLVSPPWTRPRGTTPPVVIAGLTLDAPTRVVWADGEREQVLTRGRQSTSGRYDHPGVDWAAQMARYGGQDWMMPTLLLHAPQDLALPALAAWQPKRAYNLGVWGPALLARFDVAAVPVITAVVTSNNGHDDFRALLPVLDTEVASVMASAMTRRKMARPVVRAWLRQHGLATLPYLLPTALGRAGKARDAAEAMLRALAQEGDAPVVAEAMRLAGAEAGEGVARVLATDPLELLPKKLPVPGAWADPAALPQIRLRGSQVALPTASTADLLTMFALGTPDEPYGGVTQVAEVCDPGSLAGFGWAVFEAWRAAGMPPKDGWALTSLAAVGDDETVRRLAPVIRAWPGEGGHARAVTGLEVLAEIGTDVALMHLNGIAQKVKFSGLRQRAGEKIELVAAKLGLTAEQLADRLVPDLGLADDGTLVLDYGPRRFVVGFDEALRPTVSDEDGTRRKALPKPGANDDQDLAAAAYQRFSGLKKDVRTLASDQITRLERAMVAGRRWSQEDFARYFSGHPLLWHVVRRLVWGVHDERDVLVGSFRVAEDRTLADADDATYTPPEGATVGVAHPLHLGDALAAWAEVFADYEILQPFPQLGRPVLALTDEERAALTLTRFDKVTVSVGRVLGLTKRGWERTTPQDGGVEAGVVKPLAGGWFGVLELSEGIVVGAPTMLGENQEIRRVFLSADRDGWWGREDTPMGTLDALSASELLVDLTELVSAT
jgi:predicted DNA-binding WGR domain protein